MHPSSLDRVPPDLLLQAAAAAHIAATAAPPTQQVLKRFIMHSKKTAFVVEHDFIMATYLADKVVVYEGQASVHATARAPQGLQTGAPAGGPWGPACMLGMRTAGCVHSSTAGSQHMFCIMMPV